MLIEASFSLRSDGRGSKRSFRITDLPPEWLVGFYPLETEGGSPFRWSYPTAAIDLPLPEGVYELTIGTRGIRDWPASLRWTFDGAEVPQDHIEYDREACRLRVASPLRGRRARRTLGISCLPWDVSDARRLGLPIFEITVVRLPAVTRPDHEPLILKRIAPGERPEDGEFRAA